MFNIPSVRYPPTSERVAFMACPLLTQSCDGTIGTGPRDAHDGRPDLHRVVELRGCRTATRTERGRVTYDDRNVKGVRRGSCHRLASATRRTSGSTTSRYLLEIDQTASNTQYDKLPHRRLPEPDEQVELTGGGNRGCAG
jgi:hypothetical protein